MRTLSEIESDIESIQISFQRLAELKKEREDAMAYEWHLYQLKIADEARAFESERINQSVASWAAIDEMLAKYGADIGFLWRFCGEAMFLDIFKSELEGSGYIETREEREIREYKENPYRKKKINGTIRTLVYERDSYQCVHCGVRKDLSLDHIHPESKGGATTVENLQTLCRSCNSKKGVSL